MIQINNASIVFGEEVLFSKQTFHIDKGTMACITGVSGTGKSSLLNAVMGFVPGKDSLGASRAGFACGVGDRDDSDSRADLFVTDRFALAGVALSCIGGLSDVCDFGVRLFSGHRGSTESDI